MTHIQASGSLSSRRPREAREQALVSLGITPANHYTALQTAAAPGNSVSAGLAAASSGSVSSASSTSSFFQEDGQTSFRTGLLNGSSVGERAAFGLVGHSDKALSQPLAAGSSLSSTAPQKLKKKLQLLHEAEEKAAQHVHVGTAATNASANASAGNSAQGNFTSASPGNCSAPGASGSLGLGNPQHLGQSNHHHHFRQQPIQAQQSRGRAIRTASSPDGEVNSSGEEGRNSEHFLLPLSKSFSMPLFHVPT
ncbi:unnamed protein product [Protopolystoma xenopodis]|uniref:Uncharacterized protein n=1 Tax=Protopolystoma xenopodis TaxID=117903 RepID=A0A448WM06_9PLAT|nr:unnamed protein product [Protopolystoma xenopodis]